MKLPGAVFGPASNGGVLRRRELRSGRGSSARATAIAERNDEEEIAGPPVVQVFGVEEITIVAAVEAIEFDAAAEDLA